MFLDLHNLINSQNQFSIKIYAKSKYAINIR